MDQQQPPHALPTYAAGKFFLYAVEGVGYLVSIVSLLAVVLNARRFERAFSGIGGSIAAEIETFLLFLVSLFTGFAIVAVAQVGRAIIEIAINTRAAQLTKPVQQAKASDETNTDSMS